jgi:hypothetical protein
MMFLWRTVGICLYLPISVSLMRRQRARDSIVIRQPAPAGCWTAACGGPQDSTTTSSALCGPPSGSRLRQVAELQRAGGSCSDDTMFCHLQATVRQTASAGCWRVPPTVIALYGPPPAIERDHNLPYVHNPSHGPNTYTCSPLWRIHPQPGRAALILSAAIN